MTVNLTVYLHSYVLLQNYEILDNSVSGLPIWAVIFINLTMGGVTVTHWNIWSFTLTAINEKSDRWRGQLSWKKNGTLMQQRSPTMCAFPFCESFISRLCRRLEADQTETSLTQREKTMSATDIPLPLLKAVISHDWRFIPDEHKIHEPWGRTSSKFYALCDKITLIRHFYIQPAHV